MTVSATSDPRNYFEKIETMPVHIFVPRWMDQTNTNAQNSSAQALLSRFKDPGARWTAIFTDPPVDTIRNSIIKTRHLSRSHWWPLELVLAYQSQFDAIFYPGPHWQDELGMKIRSLSGRRTPIVATLEGVITSTQALNQLSERMGHPVFSQAGVEEAIPRIRRIYESADHIIAISAFLAEVAKFLYGDKVSWLPLGLERSVFHDHGRQEPVRCRVIGCGTIKPSKNPQMFLQLAARYKESEFVWFGNGPTRQSLIAEARSKGLQNLAFPGSPSTESLAQEFRNSSIFVIPSHSEGVPKVTHEAASSGLPIVLNGFYEAPTVIHEQNGLVAWSDEELIEHVGTLIRDPDRRARMGQRSAEMAKEWDWDLIAPRWEKLIIQLVTAGA
jgi:glycosyltransferase involved in cell wall biosynthesis